MGVLGGRSFGWELAGGRGGGSCKGCELLGADVVGGGCSWELLAAVASKSSGWQ